jgi:hypothetical protein
MPAKGWRIEKDIHHSINNKQKIFEYIIIHRSFVLLCLYKRACLRSKKHISQASFTLFNAGITAWEE